MRRTLLCDALVSALEVSASVSRWLIRAFEVTGEFSALQFVASARSFMTVKIKYPYATLLGLV